MVLLTKISDESIAENLYKRIMDDFMFTCIGPVLISVNPFKSLPYFDDATIKRYENVPQHENPPHIYGATDNSYRDMLIDQENHCFIITGESGAGKTVAAKYLLNYITKISGGGTSAKKVKNVILECNPLLEAFGNAKTLRNNNSSRFGKYIEIQFSNCGVPIGGVITNFLLEKSRVVFQNKGERNFHIFYQLLVCSDSHIKETFGLSDPSYFNYLSDLNSISVEDIDDSNAFQETKHSMATIGISSSIQQSIFQLIAGVLHLGNITFKEGTTNRAQFENEDFLSFPAFLLGINAAKLKNKLTSREMVGIGRRQSCYGVELNQEQAKFALEALASNIYSRIFDYLVKCINESIMRNKCDIILGVLDIYGFEIFQKNGFDQFCINYVNEKLQQIFVELTLKAEQEEYFREKIAWQTIDYFNNKIVCDLIEEKKPPGIMAILDDICATMHGQEDGADQQFLKKTIGSLKGHAHYKEGGDNFTVVHYAGNVCYSVEGFCVKNRDVLLPDLVQFMRTSKMPFLVSLFPEKIENKERKRPVTFGYCFSLICDCNAAAAGSKIIIQANTLVDKLMKCQPHYIRCIKPNESKRPKDWDKERVIHQVKYLGLQENIRLRRAGFAYRSEFSKFLKRFGIISAKIWQKWTGSSKEGCRILLEDVALDTQEWQLGINKVFIKAPTSFFYLEELREKAFGVHAKTIQVKWREFNSCGRSNDVRTKGFVKELFLNRKERKRASINRDYYGDYLNAKETFHLSSYLGRRDQVVFSSIIEKYNSKLKAATAELILTEKTLYVIEQIKVKKGPKKGQILPMCNEIFIENIQMVLLSPLQDNFVIIKVENILDTVINCPFKTEFVAIMDIIYSKKTNKNLSLTISDKITFSCKKKFFNQSGKIKLIFEKTNNKNQVIEIIKRRFNGGLILVEIGLPKDTATNLIEPKKNQPARSSNQTWAEKNSSPNQNHPNGYKLGMNNSIGGFSIKPFPCPSTSEVRIRMDSNTNLQQSYDGDKANQKVSYGKRPETSQTFKWSTYEDLDNQKENQTSSKYHSKVSVPNKKKDTSGSVYNNVKSNSPFSTYGNESNTFLESRALPREENSYEKRKKVIPSTSEMNTRNKISQSNNNATAQPNIRFGNNPSKGKLRMNIPSAADYYAGVGPMALPGISPKSNL